MRTMRTTMRRKTTEADVIGKLSERQQRRTKPASEPATQRGTCQRSSDGALEMEMVSRTVVCWLSACGSYSASLPSHALERNLALSLVNKAGVTCAK